MSLEDQDQPDDFRAAITGAISEVEEKTPGSTGKLADVAPKTPTEQVTKPVVQDDDDKPAQSGQRGADGKFLPKTGETKPPAEVKVDANSPAVAAVEVKPESTAPATWRAEAKADWDKLPPGVKAEIAKREVDYSKGIEAKANEFKQIKSQLDEIEPAIGPRRAALVANYGSMGAALKKLFDISDFATKDAPGFIAWFSQQNGVDLHGLLQGAQAPAQVAPEVAQLHQTINGLSERLRQFEGHTQQTQIRSVASDFDALESEADEKGAPKRPFWGELRDGGLLSPEMALVRQEHPDWSTRQIGEAAYERVVWKHSDTRAKILSQRDQQAIADREAKERAAAAGNARKSITGSPPGKHVPTGAPEDNLRAEISREVYARQGGDTRL